MTPEPVSDQVARELYPIAVDQAKEQIIRESIVVVVCLVAGVLTGFRYGTACLLAPISVGMVSTVYDIRWWLWLRTAPPVEAYVRSQARTNQEGGVVRKRMVLVAFVVLLGLWWWARR